MKHRFWQRVSLVFPTESHSFGLVRLLSGEDSRSVFYPWLKNSAPLWILHRRRRLLSFPDLGNRPTNARRYLPHLLLQITGIGHFDQCPSSGIADFHADLVAPLRLLWLSLHKRRFAPLPWVDGCNIQRRTTP